MGGDSCWRCCDGVDVVDGNLIAISKLCMFCLCKCRRKKLGRKLLEGK